MLRAGRFGGDEKKLLESANALWREFSRSVDDPSTYLVIEVYVPIK